MSMRRTIVIGLFLAWSGVVAAAETTKPAATPTAATPGSPSARAARAKSFKRDTTVLARIDDRVIRADEYVGMYFDSYPEFRPAADSSGRVEFLNTMINKEVLNRVARASGRTLGFEDRQAMREHQQRVLSNVLFQRVVADSVEVTDAQVEQVLTQFSRDIHLREILFSSPEAAETARAQILAKKATWTQVAKANRVAPDAKDEAGDIGWIVRANFDPMLGIEVFDLAPGQISQLITDQNGYHLFQAVETRKTQHPVTIAAFRGMVREQMLTRLVDRNSDRLKRLVGRDLGMAIDSANVVWAASHFQPTQSQTKQGNLPHIEINATVPEFANEDTSRVLIRYKGGQVTLAQFMHHYSEIPAVLRPNVHSPRLLLAQLEGYVLEPLMARLAVERGLDKDPMAVRLIENRRDQLLVERMYQDSIAAKVYVPVEERRKYYQEHPNYYVTWPQVRYAALFAPTKASADSLRARLVAGEKAEAIITADSLTGFSRGSIQERRGDDKGSPYYKVLFEEMRPRDVTIQGPDDSGGYAVLQLLTQDSGHSLTFEEADQFVSESVTSLAEEKLLKAFLARHKARHTIETYPERLMSVRMVPNL